MSWFLNHTPISVKDNKRFHYISVLSHTLLVIFITENFDEFDSRDITI